MRYFQKGPVLKLRAIAGLHVVMLAWDFSKKLSVTGVALPSRLKNLMGFSTCFPPAIEAATGS